MFVEDEHIKRFRVKLIYYFSGVGIFCALLFGVVPDLTYGDYVFGLYELVLVLIASLNLAVFHFRKNYDMASNIILLLMVFMLTGLIINGGYQKTGIYWIYTFPLFSFFLKPSLKALLWNLLLCLSLLLALFLERKGFIEVSYTDAQILRASFAYLAVMFLSFMYSIVVENLVFLLKNRAIKDPLTGLYNRAYVIEILENILNRVRREDSGDYCIAYIDLDNFKRINDQFGHHEGDKLLRNISFKFKKYFRKGDIVGRIGGDEFVVIFHNAKPSDVKRRLDVLRKEIATSEEFKRISFSYGVVAIDSERLDNVDELLKRVDKKMYDMKKLRDRRHRFVQVL